MKSFKFLTPFVISFFYQTGSVAAQYRNSPPNPDLACAACGGTVLTIIATIMAINIAILVWVARDAKSRGMENSMIWMLLVFCTGIIGLIIYWLARPTGEMITCPNCDNKKLKVLIKCPHCGI